MYHITKASYFVPCTSNRSIMLGMGELKNIENTNDFTQLRAPHEAIFLVLAYLPVFELIEMSKVCKSLKDEVENDILPWLKIIVDKPLNTRLTNDYLRKITSKANGLLKSLALINCTRITDDGLLLVVEENPLLEKLFVTGCTRLTPGAVIKAVEMIPKLKSLKINGIYNVNKDVLQTLHQQIREMSLPQTRVFNFYHRRHRTIISSVFENDDEVNPSIDLEICPRCQEVRMVFDCPRESCIVKVQNSPTSHRHEINRCRACYYCIPRCEECGMCIKDEVGEAACQDILCLDCWLELPKCNFCNKAYCRTHVDQKTEYPDSSDGFLCQTCNELHLDVCTSDVNLAIEDEE